MHRPALTLAACMLSFGVWAADSLSCPPQVGLNPPQVNADSVPARFKPITPPSAPANAVLRLSGLSVYDGPPEEGAVLMPDSIQGNPSQETLKWQLNPAHPTWVSCDYAQGQARLATLITGQPRGCTASVKKLGDGGGVEIGVRCEE
jgi:hypothetical protein